MSYVIVRYRFNSDRKSVSYTKDYKDTQLLRLRCKSLLNGSETYSNNDRTVTFTGTRSGSKVDDWKERTKKGLPATSVFTSDRRKLLRMEPGGITGVYQYVRPGYASHLTTRSFEGFAGNNSLDQTMPHVAVSTNVAEAKALSKSYKKLEAEMSHMNSAAVVAEIFDVFRQFSSPARSLVDLTNRRLNRLELEKRGLSGSTSFKEVRWREIVASTYLEWAFGVAPVIAETEKAAQALAHFDLEAGGHKFPPRKRIVSRGTESSGSVTVQDLTIPLQFETAQNAIKAKTDYRVQYVIGLEGSLLADFGSNRRLQQLLGFEPRHWVPALWEAVPWSWLVDYFSNVGQILQAAATTTATVKWICKTQSYRTTHTYAARVFPPPVINGYYHLKSFSSSPNSGGVLETLRTTVTRSIPTNLGVPPLVVTHPFDSYKKVANMVAVMFAREPRASALWLT